jgi:hypothetical protein
MRATVLAWKRAGEGEPLVLRHGIGTMRNDFVRVGSRPPLHRIGDSAGVGGRHRAPAAAPGIAQQSETEPFSYVAREAW